MSTSNPEYARNGKIYVMTDHSIARAFDHNLKFSWIQEAIEHGNLRIWTDGSWHFRGKKCRLVCRGDGDRKRIVTVKPSYKKGSISSNKMGKMRDKAARGRRKRGAE